MTNDLAEIAKLEEAKLKELQLTEAEEDSKFEEIDILREGNKLNKRYKKEMRERMFANIDNQIATMHREHLAYKARRKYARRKYREAAKNGDNLYQYKPQQQPANKTTDRRRAENKNRPLTDAERTKRIEAHRATMRQSPLQKKLNKLERLLNHVVKLEGEESKNAALIQQRIEELLQSHADSKSI